MSFQPPHSLCNCCFSEIKWTLMIGFYIKPAGLEKELDGEFLWGPEVNMTNFHHSIFLFFIFSLCPDKFQSSQSKLLLNFIFKYFFCNYTNLFIYFFDILIQSAMPKVLCAWFVFVHKATLGVWRSSDGFNCIFFSFLSAILQLVELVKAFVNVLDLLYFYWKKVKRLC